MTYKQFHPTDQFAIRRPLLNYKDKFLDKNYIDNLIRQDYFQEAIYYASPDLHSELLKYIEGSLSEKKAQRMSATIYKYAQRMLYRCTPFGMFALCGTGEYSDKTVIPDNTSLSLHYRYDFQFLYDYVTFLIKNASPELLSTLSVCANQSILRIDGKYKMKARNEQGIVTEIRVGASELLESILENTRCGIGVKELMDSCQEIYDITTPDLYNYLKKMIEKGILISDLQITTNGEDCFSRIYDKWGTMELPLMSDMKELLSILRSDSRFSEKKDAIESLYDKALALGIPVKRNQLIQVDAYSTCKATIDSRMKESLTEWFSLMSAINMPSGNPLANFAGRFDARYENMPVPLLSLLDKQTGIGLHMGFPSNSALIDKIYGTPGTRRENTAVKSFSLTIFEQAVLEKLIKSKSLTTKQIKLTDTDFNKYSKNDMQDCSLSYSCMFGIVGYDDNGPLLSGVHFSGPSASCLLTRFADGLDGIHDMVDEIGQCEQNAWPDVLLAEMSHLARPHSGNVQVRPDFRQYCIPYLSYADDRRCEPIEIKDISVEVSGGKVKLYSQSRKKEIMPCYSSAFNYKFGTSDLYQFLGDIQHQNSSRMLTAQTDSLLSLLRHVPRVSYKNIIVTPETWIVDNHWDDADYSKAAHQFKTMKERLCMPRFLSFYQGDNYFIIDSESDISVREFFNLSKNIGKLALKEFLPLANDINHYDCVMEIIQPFIP